MERMEALELLKQYNETLSSFRMSDLEYSFLKCTKEKYFYNFREIKTKDYFKYETEVFLKKNHYFKELVKEESEALCTYLREVTSYSYTSGYFRISVRSNYLYDRREKLINEIGAFYLFRACNLNIVKLIQGYYPQMFAGSFAPVIASRILCKDETAIQAIKEVLLSENNVGILTRDLIVGIEQGNNEELHDLLLKVFLAARLQEGLRQSIAETCDENQYSFFKKSIRLIVEEDLIRYSSIQRAVMTWCGLGYQEAKEKQCKNILHTIALFMEQEETRIQALKDENPMNVYLALFVKGSQDVDEAEKEAISLFENTQLQIVAAAIVYLESIQRFHTNYHMDLFDKWKENDWITALLYKHLHTSVFPPFKNKEEAYRFLWDMKQFTDKIKNEQTFTCKGFEWYQLSISKTALINQMADFLHYYSEPRFIEIVLPYVSSLWGGEVETFMRKSFPKLDYDQKVPFLIKNIIYDSGKLQEEVKRHLLRMTLKEEDLILLEERLKTKNGKSRAYIVEILAEQPKEQILASYERLSNSNLKYKQDSAKELRQKASVYFEKDAQEITYRMEDGLGLFDKNKSYSIPCVNKIPTKTKKRFFRKEEVFDLSSIFLCEKQWMNDYFHKWSNRIKEHEKDTYTYLGEDYQIKDRFHYVDYSKDGFEAYPFSDLWKTYFEEDQLSKEQLFCIGFFMRQYQYTTTWKKVFSSTEGSYVLNDDIFKLPYFNIIFKLINAYEEEKQKEYRTYYLEKATILIQFILNSSIEPYFKEKEYNEIVYKSTTSLDIYEWLDHIVEATWENDEEFKEIFPVCYQAFDYFTRKTEPKIRYKGKLSPFMVSKAICMGLCDQSLLYEVLLTSYGEKGNYYSNRIALGTTIRDLYFNEYRSYQNKKADYNREYPDKRYHPEEITCLKEALETITDRIIESECARINDTSDVTSLVKELSAVFGIERLVKLLKEMKEENFTRNSYGSDKKDTLTFLIKHCYPLDCDTGQMLGTAGIKEERYVELAMLAPQWMNLVDEYLKWDGFKEGCYYFIAHMKEAADEEKKAEIAKYTDIDPFDLRDGAFDMQWCKQVYEKLGEKRFQILYKAAKFLCENSFHTRGRKYADACLNKSKKEDLLKQVREKRNKDALNAYCIVPLSDDKDLLERYMQIQLFAKEAKQFGAQRQQSEKRCAQIAMINLARNSRFESDTRLAWMMESTLVKQYEHLLQPQTISEYECKIEFDSYGKNQIIITKNGKRLTSTPAKIKKTEAFKELSEIHKKWNEQYRRSKEMLETAMCERTLLSKEELDAIAQNPVVSKMLHSLVLCQKDQFGFYKEGMLELLNRETVLLDEARIAHAYDLYHAQVWHDYQQKIFNEKMIQPFKQVFRELYLKLEDELEVNHSMRYSGYQIQVKKAAAALKTRKWNTSYESGIERICYKDDLIVNLWANADWFSPSDIEAPAIDDVSFISRKEGKKVLIKDISPIMYSEIMRDLDMAVSIGYVGGVDPQTSSSTMELRAEIIRFTMQLMKLENVSIEGHFANIKGTLNNYSVHLGSGTVNQSEAGAIHILPVHSQKRGKLYLPFLDEDPKTAEILSKIVLLAEDQKLKDPTILSQIKRVNS